MAWQDCASYDSVSITAPHQHCVCKVSGLNACHAFLSPYMQEIKLNFKGLECNITGSKEVHPII